MADIRAKEDFKYRLVCLVLPKQKGKLYNSQNDCKQLFQCLTSDTAFIIPNNPQSTSTLLVFPQLPPRPSRNNPRLLMAVVKQIREMQLRLGHDKDLQHNDVNGLLSVIARNATPMGTWMGWSHEF